MMIKFYGKFPSSLYFQLFTNSLVVILSNVIFAGHAAKRVDYWIKYTRVRTQYARVHCTAVHNTHAYSVRPYTIRTRTVYGRTQYARVQCTAVHNTHAYTVRPYTSAIRGYQVRNSINAQSSCFPVKSVHKQSFELDRKRVVTTNYYRMNLRHSFRRRLQLGLRTDNQPITVRSGVWRRGVAKGCGQGVWPRGGP